MNNKNHKTQRKMKSMARAKGTVANTRLNTRVIFAAKKEEARDVIVVRNNLDEKLRVLAESAKGRIQYIPATKDEVAHIIVPPDVDEAIGKSIHLSDFLPARASA